MRIRAQNILLAETLDGTSPIYPGKTVEVKDEIGEYFISIGAAVEAQFEPVATANKATLVSNPDGNTPDGENAQNGVKNGIPVNEGNNTMDRAYLEGLTFAELKDIAKSLCVYDGSMKSKASIIEALMEVPVSDEAAPVLGVQDVIEE